METPTESPTARRPGPLTYVMNGLAVCLAVAMLIAVSTILYDRFRPHTEGQAAPTEQAPPPPTLAPAVRQQLQQAAPNTAVEQQQIAQPPAIAPAIATPAPVPAPAAGALPDAPDPSRYSPIDLGWAPVPTPTTMLSQEQYDASQASEEQNQLNTAEQGLTEAQKLVKIHEAEQHAQAQP